MKTKFRNLPITLKVNLWYSTFILLLMVSSVTLALILSSTLGMSVSQRQLKNAVNEVAKSPEKFESFDSGIFYINYDHSGEILAGKYPLGFNLKLKLEEDKVRVYEKKDYQFYYYDSKIKNSNYWIRGVYPINHLAKDRDRMLSIILVFAPIFLSLVILGGNKILKRGFMPVKVISDTALDITESQDFSKRIELEEGSDEIHKMADTFNTMLESLESSYLREKQFNSNVSHELKTPISVILAESSYSLEHADNIEEAKESFEVIKRQSKKMSELITQIMMLSKIENTTTLELMDINLSYLIDNMLADNLIIFEDKGIKLSKNIQKNIIISGDKIMLERMIDNLISNALKFTRNTIGVSLTSKNGKVYFEVNDNGEGIEEKNLVNIFNRFYQINESRNKSKNQGSGLGLSLVQEIVKLHNGEISVESNPNVATKFTVIFKK
ncbi:HAMP domain-containing sensor histidine kinase [Streptobacillus canis]|uniref:HAMP domain-containing sensor histidine kinase n=1 Tax=Streptobacillus canis TaxID=2678686 RepID=UPI0012E2952F|nr:HAMP domain-containing sensor histidine kinase [Streptobacillus canis]